MTDNQLELLFYKRREGLFIGMILHSPEKRKSIRHKKHKTQGFNLLFPQFHLLFAVISYLQDSPRRTEHGCQQTWNHGSIITTQAEKTISSISICVCISFFEHVYGRLLSSLL